MAAAVPAAVPTLAAAVARQGTAREGGLGVTDAGRIMARMPLQARLLAALGDLPLVAFTLHRHDIDVHLHRSVAIAEAADYARRIGLPETPEVHETEANTQYWWVGEIDGIRVEVTLIPSAESEVRA